jgi:hypothetical protein
MVRKALTCADKSGLSLISDDIFVLNSGPNSPKKLLMLFSFQLK